MLGETQIPNEAGLQNLYIPIEKWQEMKNKVVQRACDNNYSWKQTLGKLYCLIVSYQDRIGELLSKIKHSIWDHQEQVEKANTYLKYHIDRINVSISDVLTQYNKQISTFEKFRKELLDDFKEMEPSADMKQLFSVLIDYNNNSQNNFIEESYKLEQQILKGEQKAVQKIKQIPHQPLNDKEQDLTKFQYVKLNDSTFKERDTCRAFAFSADSSIMFVACEQVILVLELENNKIKYLSQSIQKNNKICCLIAMKRSKQLVSAGYEKQITIYRQDNNYQWLEVQQLAGHNEAILSIVINEEEDLLISGSQDKTIKIWQCQGGTWVCQQTVDVQFEVYCTILNPSKQQIVACGSESKCIKVIESNQEWNVTQKIVVNQGGYRLCFINKNQFVFQLKSIALMELYNFDELQNQFVKSKTIQLKNIKNCEYLFPCQFIESKKLLLIKHGYQINCFGINQEGDLFLQQSILLSTNSMFGKATEDGNLLVTYQYELKEIQFQQLKYQQ